ncbi:MAG: transcriptional repressor LexA [Desulfobacterales bacterium]|nr:transcriptional repressor LexA [Desulfobacterales bacterium]
MRSKITKKQQQFFEYLENAAKNKGAFPSLREIADDIGVSHTAVANMLKILEEKGYIKKEGRYSRKTHILNRAYEVKGFERCIEIPIIGTIAAGLPMYAQQEWDGSIVLDSSIFKGKNLFCLRIKGDSMKNIGILNGDLAICEPRQYACNGEIVVALINGEEASVKRFFLHKDKIELRPENEKYQPMFYSFGEVLIQGRVIGIQRTPDIMIKI